MAYWLFPLLLIFLCLKCSPMVLLVHFFWLHYMDTYFCTCSGRRTHTFHFISGHLRPYSTQANGQQSKLVFLCFWSCTGCLQQQMHLCFRLTFSCPNPAWMSFWVSQRMMSSGIFWSIFNQLTLFICSFVSTCLLRCWHMFVSTLWMLFET